MAYFEFLWTEEIVAKLAARDLTTEEVEDIVCHPLVRTTSRSSGRPAVIGYADDGRLLFIPYDEIDDILVQVSSAYEIQE